MSRSELYELKKEKGLVTRKEFYEKHKACPDCNNTKLQQTLVGVIEYENIDFIDNFNSARCKCGWRGKVNELIESEENG